MCRPSVESGDDQRAGEIVLEDRILKGGGLHAMDDDAVAVSRYLQLLEIARGASTRRPKTTVKLCEVNRINCD